MDPQNLNTASAYINNLLLSRGLLRNGKSIDFAKPSNDPAGTEASIAKIVNLVHDLVLRRDREADLRENLATSVRSLRSSEAKQGLEIERLKTQNADLTRSLSLAEGQERAFKSTLRNAEASARTLREQMLRMKSTLQQVRTQCANDIRKRDIQIQKLKQHMTGMQRGRREGLGVSTITITPLPSTSSSARVVEGGKGLDSPEYSLKQETTEFLTGLCQNLSDENDALIAMSRDTIETLKSLQGLPLSPLLAEDQISNDVRNRGSESVVASSGENDLVKAPLASYDSLAAELESVLAHLRTLLTNPSFVPIEEVEARDDEIVRLREGWVKMEGRWKEALVMMDGWRKRIVDGGDSVKIEELRVGLGLGQSIAGNRPPQVKVDESNVSYDSEEDGDMEGGIAEEEGIDSLPEDLWLPQEEPSTQTLTPFVGGRNALRVSNGNARKLLSPRKVSFRTSPERLPMEGSDSVGVDEVLSSEISKSEASARASSSSNKSKIPRQKIAKGVSSPMSVSEKLAAVEVEATIAEQQRKVEQPDVKRRPSKNTRKGKSRRRSTLSPEELESLIGIHD